MDTYNRQIMILILFAALAVLGLGMFNIRLSANSVPTFASTNYVSTAVISTAANGYDISNITVINPFGVTISGSYFWAYINYVSAGSAVMVLNGSAYGLYNNRPGVLVRQTRKYNFYAKLISSSYLSNTPSASIYLYSVGRASVPVLNSTYTITGYIPLIVNVTNASTVVKMNSQTSAPLNLVIMNVTNALTTSPQGFRPLLVLNVSTISSANVTTSLTMAYNCSLPQASIIPYKQNSHGIWITILPFTVDPTKCTASFTIPSDPIAGLFQSQNQGTNATTSASTVGTTVPSSVTTTVPESPLNLPGEESILVVAAIIAIAIVYYAATRKQKPQKGKQAK